MFSSYCVCAVWNLTVCVHVSRLLLCVSVCLSSLVLLTQKDGVSKVSPSSHEHKGLYFACHMQRWNVSLQFTKQTIHAALPPYSAGFHATSSLVRSTAASSKCVQIQREFENSVPCSQKHTASPLAVKDIWGNNSCLIWKSHETHKYTLWVKHVVFNVQASGT